MEKKMNQKMQELIDGCDCVIVPDTGDDSGNRVHVGPIVREPSASREELRKKFGFDRPTIIACVGGTDAGRFLIERTIAAFRKLSSRLEADLVIVSGPTLSLPDSITKEYRNMGFVDNLHEIILASDLVVSLAGRSTMDESIASGTPGIFIPIKNHFEQEDGAARLGFKHEDIFRLEQLIEEKLTSMNSMRKKIDGSAKSSGAEKAAKIISSYL
jgi:UDP-N-acetylglucosamine--N-acetylmuramyl-(pentapeptide) pyrophosphoryl-undecaprenol N-acetylglucosamine transferase